MPLYAFDADTKRCHFTTSEPFENMGKYIVIESPLHYNICNIIAVRKGSDTASFYDIEETAAAADFILAQLKHTRMKYLKLAQDNLALLTEIAEFAPSDGDAEKITAWKKYRSAVYRVKVDALKADKIKWPTMPEREI